MATTRIMPLHIGKGRQSKIPPPVVIVSLQAGIGLHSRLFVYFHQQVIPGIRIQRCPVHVQLVADKLHAKTLIAAPLRPYRREIFIGSQTVFMRHAQSPVPKV